MNSEEVPTTYIIDGKARAAEILLHLKQEIQFFQKTFHGQITLAIVLVGNNPASEIYVRNKMKAAAATGINAHLVRLDNSISNDELLLKVRDLNNDKDVSGIIVQMPLPAHIDKNQIINAVSPAKDVDGFTLKNIGALYSASSKASALQYDISKPLGNVASASNNQKGIDSAYHIACTARGALDLILTAQKDIRPLGKTILPLEIELPKNSIASKHAVIIGRSNIVGRPLAALLLQNDCTVTIAHSKTKFLKPLTRSADIVISAMGKPRSLTKEYFNENAIVIDIGITKVEDPVSNGHKIAGDVDFDDVFGHVAALTPVPGGVGPMTVAYLLVNCFRAAAIMALQERY